MNSSEVFMFLFCCVITIGAYGISRIMMVRFPSPLTTPVFFSTVIVILIMLPLQITLEDYQLASDVMTFLLGPATVALAVPLYKNRFIIKKYWRAAGLGLAVGALSTIISAVLILKLFQVPNDFLVAMSAKSVTVPIRQKLFRLTEIVMLFIYCKEFRMRYIGLQLLFIGKFMRNLYFNRFWMIYQELEKRENSSYLSILEV